MNTYEKATKGMYLEKYSKSGNLMRNAEQLESGNWVVWVYGKYLDISGEYTEEEFKRIKKLYF